MGIQPRRSFANFCVSTSNVTAPVFLLIPAPTNGTNSPFKSRLDISSSSFNVRE